MSITREQVADLQPGDVVELILDGQPAETYRLTARLTGHRNGELSVGGESVIRFGDGRPPSWTERYSLAVIGRALYVNHPRTEPVPGDVVRDADKPGAEDNTVWLYTGEFRPGSQYGGWAHTTGSGAVIWAGPADPGYPQLPTRLRLLVDGETGQVVP